MRLGDIINNSNKEFGNIIEGYRNYLFPVEDVESLSRERLMICHRCTKIGKNIFGVEVCTECGCWLVGKTRSKNEYCKLGYWKEVF